MIPDSSWLLGGLITTAALILRWQGNSWGWVIGKVAVLVATSSIAVLLLAVGLRLFS